MCESEDLPVIQNKMDSLAKNIVGMQKFIRLYISLALILKPIEGGKILCMKLK